MRYFLELNVYKGIRLNYSSAGMWWERMFYWITWGEYSSEEEAEAVGRDMRASSPKMCIGWNVRTA